MKKLLILFLILYFVLLGCAPETRYRREALVPGPQAPPYRGEPLGRKHIELEAQLTGSDVYETAAVIHDPALWIPEVHLNASALIGVARFLDLGLLFTYAHGSWAENSAVGTPPMPADGKNLFAIGPQLGIAGKSENGKLFGGGYLSTQYVRIPWSEWERVGLLPYQEEDEGDLVYELRNSGADDDIYYRVGLYFGGRPLPWLALNVGLVLCDSWINDGFSDEPAQGSTLEHGHPTVMPVFGARFEYEMFYVNSSVTWPISTEDKVAFVPLGWSLGMGIRI